MKKNNRLKPLGWFILLGVILMLPSVFAWSNTTFNNSISTETILFDGVNNVTRYLSVPQSTYITNAYLNITGFLKSGLNISGNVNTPTSISPSAWRGQTFRITENATLKNVYFIFNSSTDAGTNITVIIKNADASGLPTGAANLSVGSLISNFDSTPSLRKFVMSPIPLLAGYNYTAIAYANNSVTGFWVNTSGTLYAFGNQTTSNNGGTSWTVSTADAPLFIETTLSESQLYIGDENATLPSANGTIPVLLQTSNLASMVNNYLSDCTYILGYCNVPFIFRSLNSGNLTYSDMIFNNTGMTINSETYNMNTSSFSTETFTISINYDSNQYSSIIGYLVYNGTEYLSSRTGPISTPTMTRTITIPSYQVSSSVPFYWRFVLSNSTSTFNYNSTQHLQTVSTMLVDDCSAYTNVILNFTNYDEETTARLNETNYDVQVKIGDSTLTTFRQYNTNKTNAPSAAICTQSFINSTYRLDYSVIYSKTGYTSRNYNTQNLTFNADNQNRNVSLYSLLAANSQIFSVRAADQNYLPLSNVVIEVNRDYLATGNPLIIQSPMTDNSGRTTANFITTSNPSYDVNIRRDGSLIASFNDIQVYCATPAISECLLILNIPASTVSIDSSPTREGVFFSTDYNSTSRIFTFDFTSQDNSIKIAELTGTLFDNYGNVSVCTSSISGTQGSLNCLIPSQYQNKTVIMKGYIDGELLFSEAVRTGRDLRVVFGKTRYILAAMLIPMLVLMGSASGAVAIVFLILGLITAVAIGLIDTTSWFGPGSFLAWGIIAAVILIWKASKGGVKNG